MTTWIQDRPVPEVLSADGMGAVRYTTGTTAQTGSWRQVYCLKDTVFAALVRTNASGDAITGVMLPAGTILIGPITSYQLTSGAVAAYE